MTTESTVKEDRRIYATGQLKSNPSPRVWLFQTAVRLMPSHTKIFEELQQANIFADHNTLS